MRAAALVISCVACGRNDAPQQAHASAGDGDGARVGVHVLTPSTVSPIDSQNLRIKNADPGEPPPSMVVVSSTPRFYIDRTEVTVGEYRECVDAKACQPPIAFDSGPVFEKWKSWDAERPVTFVSPQQAWDYCTFRGNRLPTPKEWMRAALGVDGRKFPWGNTPPSCKVAVLARCSSDFAKVGSIPAGASPYGALDMAGNVNEYVNRDTSGSREQIDAAVSGGNLGTETNELADVFDERSGYATAHEITGIRCARTPKSPD